ncbi:MAG: imidazolonepropionase [Spirochaetaceae bacterium]|nr:imidazolonepropionase [Spirochaetaceae bacterium]
MNLTVHGIGRLLTMSGAPLRAAAVVIRNGRVAWTGPESDLPRDAPPARLDVAGACVVPGFVDAHTHLLYAGVRREEFAARLAGRAYDGGGIATTVTATAAATDAELLDLASGRAALALSHGTTTMEVKSGYGLTVESELRLLRLADELRTRTPIGLEVTYLGAHVVPPGRDRGEYVDEVVATLPAAVVAGARWCDVFCDEGVFTVEEARRILTAAREAGLGLRLHAEEIAPTGAAGLAAELGCASADHLEHVSTEDARAMAAAGVVGVLLPTVTFSLRSGAWTHAGVLRAAGVELALATDCNPGTSWCESMPYAVQLACLAMGLSVDEAFRAATLGAAHSLRRADIGHLAVGARGDLAVLNAEHEADVVAHLGGAAVTSTVVGGEVRWMS